MKISAIVPLRSDSTRLPGKNTKAFVGRPLYRHILDALFDCRGVETVYVDSCDAEISDVILGEYPSVVILMRPERLRGPEVTANHLLDWDLQRIPESEHFLWTHATNPLLTARTIHRAIKRYLSSLEIYDSLFGVTENYAMYYDSLGKPMNHDPSNLKQTQDLQPIYQDCSCLYLFSRESFGKTGSRIGSIPQLFVVNKLEAVDIDTEEDFILAEAIAKCR